MSVYVKDAPLLTPNLYLIGHYGRMDEDSTIREAKLNHAMNSARVEALFYKISGDLAKQYPGFPAIAFYHETDEIRSSYLYNCEDERSWLDQYPFFNRNLDKLFSFHPKDPIYTKDIGEFDVENALDINVLADSASETVFPEDAEHPVEIDMTELEEAESVTDQMEDSDGDTGEDDMQDDMQENREDFGEYDRDDDDLSSYCSESVNELEEEPTDHLHIYSFPVTRISIEKCECTLADLIQSSGWSADMVPGMLFQVAAILYVYQQKFAFTHNDLHTNNIMANRTDSPYIHYTIDSKVYKVPTHGYIYKLIDFNRSIFTWNEKTYYSDEYAPGENAYGVYNSGPFYNKKKPLCEPNPAFDLCYLACSLFNTLLPVCVDSYQLTPLQQLLIRWVTDKDGNNIVRSRTGVAKNEGIKLYKVIARHVQYPVPRHVISKEPLFQEFVVPDKKIDATCMHIEVDRI